MVKNLKIAFAKLRKANGESPMDAHKKPRRARSDKWEFGINRGSVKAS
jgi:hypothetical protein